MKISVDGTGYIILVSNPGLLKKGRAVHDFLNPDLVGIEYQQVKREMKFSYYAFDESQ
jgi:UDP-glucose 6-dehydrogenase